MVMIFDPEDMIYYLTTLGQLDSEKKKSKVVQLMQFEKELSRRQGYKRLKRVHLKLNKDAKIKKKASTDGKAPSQISAS